MNGTTGEKERGERRGKRRIMVELVTIPWIAEEDSLHLHQTLLLTNTAATWEHGWDRVAVTCHQTLGT